MSSQKTLTPEQYEKLGHLTQGLIHTINNSLGSISGFAGFLKEDLPEDSEPYLFASNILASSEHLKKLIQHLRAITSAMRHTPEIKELDLCAILEPLLIEVGEKYNALHPAHQLDINYAIEDECIPVQGDAHILTIALREILENAAEAAADAAGAISIEIKRQDDGGLILDISDSGPGLDDTELEKCGEPFFTTKDSAQHHGLGLFVTRTLLAPTPIKFSIKSRKGSGTSVTLNFAP